MFPRRIAGVMPTPHLSAPYDVAKNRETNRPVKGKAEDGRSDPDRLRQIVQPRSDGAHWTSYVNVTYIHIIGPVLRLVKPALSGFFRAAAADQPESLEVDEDSGLEQLLGRHRQGAARGLAPTQKAGA